LDPVKAGQAPGRVAADEIRQREGDEGADKAADTQLLAGGREGAPDFRNRRAQLVADPPDNGAHDPEEDQREEARDHEPDESGSPGESAVALSQAAFTLAVDGLSAA